MALSIFDITPAQNTTLMTLDSGSYFLYEGELYVTTDAPLDDGQVECFVFEEKNLTFAPLYRSTIVTPVIIKGINYSKKRREG